jgi:hypothetical protein
MGEASVSAQPFSFLNDSWIVLSPTVALRCGAESRRCGVDRRATGACPSPVRITWFGRTFKSGGLLAKVGCPAVHCAHDPPGSIEVNAQRLRPGFGLRGSAPRFFDK